MAMGILTLGKRLFGGADATAEVLVLESDDLVVRGAVLRHGPGGEMCVAGHHESAAMGLGAALADIIRAASASGAGLPSRAILLSSQVHSMVLSLPVDPRKPLPWKQMQEMLRWELEPYMSQNQARRIGAILVGRGYMTSANLDRVLRDMELRGSGSGADIRPRRFGELALEARLVTKEQLEECLSFQQSLQSFEGSAVCGWTPLEAPPEGGKWKWLVAGVAEDFRRHLVETFDKHHLRLCAIYPLVGCAAVCLNGGAKKASVVLEYHGGFLGCTHLSASGQVLHSRSVFTHEAGVPLDSCSELCDKSAEHVWLAGRWPDLDGAAEAIEGCLGKSCAAIPLKVELPPASDAGAASFAGVSGASAHFLGRAGACRAVCIPAEDPLPPLVQDRWFRLAAVAGSAAVVLLGAAVLFGIGRMKQEEVLQAGDKLAAMRRDVGTLGTRLGEQRTKLGFLNKTLPERQNLVPGLLQALETCWSEEVLIQRIAEKQDGAIELQGWGLSLQGIQAFKIGLQYSLPDWKVTDSGKSVRQERGWGSLPGYAFEVTLAAGPAASQGGGKP